MRFSRRFAERLIWGGGGRFEDHAKAGSRMYTAIPLPPRTTKQKSAAAPMEALWRYVAACQHPPPAPTHTSATLPRVVAEGGCTPPARGASTRASRQLCLTVPCFFFRCVAADATELEALGTKLSSNKWKKDQKLGMLVRAPSLVTESRAGERADRASSASGCEMNE